MRCRVFQKYSAHRLVTTLSTHRHAAFWNTRHAVVFPMFQKWSFGASSRDSGRYVDADLKQTAIPQINQMAISFKTFTMPSLRGIWVTSSTKRRELRHEDFWNTWHTAPRCPFQNVHVERCVTSIHPYNPFLHEAPRASSQRLLKQTARCAAPPVSKCESWALRRQYISIQPISPPSDGSFVTTTFETDGTQRHAVCFIPYPHEATGASSRRLLKHMAHSATPSVSKCACWALRHQYTSIQPISLRSTESLATKTFETDGTLIRAVCFKMWIMSAASPIYIHTTVLPTKRRELRHEDFWNIWHTAPGRLFQDVHVERCVISIHPYNPSLHEAPRASPQRLLKQTARCAAPSVSKCESWVLRRQYISIQPISPRSDGSFVTKTFETHGTQRHAVCFKMCMLSAASPVYIHTTHFPTKRR